MNPSTALLTIPLLLTGLACDRGRPKEHDHSSAEAAKAHEHEGDHARATGSAQAEGHDHAHLALEGVLGVKFQSAPEPVSEGAWLPGEATGDESASRILSAPVKGIVTGLPVPPGRAVGAGTVLATLQSPELARLKADWIGARAKLERMEADCAREARLFAAGAGSRRELEAAEAERTTARAEEESARLALEALGLKPEEAGSLFRVRAPQAGRVTTYQVQLGQGVEAGQALGGFQAAQAALVKLELSLPGPSAWAPGTLAAVRTATGASWKARVEGVPAALSPDTRRLAYRLRLQGSSLPIPGTPVEVRVPTAKAIVLPQAALQRIEGRWGVFVREGDSAAFRPVQRGAELGSDVMVLEGVRSGEPVAVEGAYLLKALHLKRTNPQEDGHGH